MNDEEIQKILEDEISDDDYQYTEKGYEPKFITKKFNKEFKEKE